MRDWREPTIGKSNQAMHTAARRKRQGTVSPGETEKALAAFIHLTKKNQMAASRKVCPMAAKEPGFSPGTSKFPNHLW